MSVMLQETSVHRIKEVNRWASYAGKLAILNVSLALLQLLIGLLNHSSFIRTAIINFLISSAISGIIAYQLIQFARKMNAAIELHDQSSMHLAVRHLKYYFAIIGLSLVAMSFILILGLLIAILTTVFHV